MGRQENIDMANVDTDKMHFSLVSPERELFSGDVDQVVVPAESGEFGALKLHAATMSVIKKGIIKIFEGNTESKMYIGGGIADVTPDGVTILAEDAVDLKSIDKDAVAAEIKNAQEDLRDAKTDADKASTSEKLERLETILANA